MSSAWRCTACNTPIVLVEARAHYDACAGGDRAERDSCALCEAPTDGAELCARCRRTALPETKETTA